MKIKGSVALVTGANRGIGRAFVAALLQRGAKKIYATARDPRAIDAADPRIEPLALDVTDERAVRETAARCRDVSLLVNNAGVCLWTAALAAPSLENARQELETNYWAILHLSRAFAPILKAQGGGAIVNILSVSSLVSFPMAGSYCVSKAALHSLTQGMRAELAAQGTQVLGVYPGPVDTRMIAHLPGDRENPAEIAEATCDALEAGEEELIARLAKDLVAAWRADPKAVEHELARDYPPQNG